MYTPPFVGRVRDLEALRLREWRAGPATGAGYAGSGIEPDT
jgi:hypothetical protein